MFGLTLHEKAKKVILREFGYAPGGFQMPILRGLALEARASAPVGLPDDFLAEMTAMKFMVVQMDSLQGLSPKARSFVDLHSQNALAFAQRSGLEETNVIYETLNIIRERHDLEPFDFGNERTDLQQKANEINETLEAINELRAMAGLGRIQESSHSRDIEWSFSTFNDWMQHFKEELSKKFPGDSDGNGAEITNFLDDDYLKKAFEDRILPRTVAEKCFEELQHVIEQVRKRT